MEQTLSSAQSIQDVNAALLARYKATQAATASTDKAGKTAPVGQASFASTLQQVEKQELPTPLKAAAAPAASSATTATVEEAEPECEAPKISRSARMACAEKATQVNYEDDELSFGDLVDLLNPLQHIPLVGTVYRELSGDEIKPDVQVAGSVLFGVATGSVLLSAVAGIASAVYEENTGKEPTVQVAESLLGEDFLGKPDPLTEQKIVVSDASDVAAATPEPAVPVAAASTDKKDTSAPVVPATTTAVPPMRTKVADAAATTATSKSLPGLLASTGGMRVGNTIYTSPMMRSAGKVVTATPVSAQTAQATNDAAASAAPTQAADATLGALIQEQAKAREAGQTLPPDLIHDMMVKALDKYKMAHTTTPSGDSAPTIQ